MAYMDYMDTDTLCLQKRGYHSLTHVFCRAECRSGMIDMIHITMQFNLHMICITFKKNGFIEQRIYGLGLSL